jgi:hypothetical protein
VRYVVEVSFEGNTVVIGLCHVPWIHTGLGPGQLRNTGLIPGRGKRFSLTCKVQTVSGPFNSYSVGTVVNIYKWKRQFSGTCSRTPQVSGHQLLW